MHFISYFFDHQNFFKIVPATFAYIEFVILVGIVFVTFVDTVSVAFVILLRIISEVSAILFQLVAIISNACATIPILFFFSKYAIFKNHIDMLRYFILDLKYI